MDASLFFSGDTLYLAAIYNDIFRDGFPLSGWKLGLQNAFFPDGAIYFLMRPFTADPGFPYRLLVIVVAAILVIAAAFIGVAVVRRNREVGPEFLWTTAAGGICLFLAASFESGKSLLFLFVPAAHGGTSVMAAAALALLLFRLRSPGRRGTGLLTALAAICFLTSFADRLFLVLFSLPAAVLLILEMRRRARRLQARIAFVIVVAASFLGFKTYALLGSLKWIHFPNASPDLYGGLTDRFRTSPLQLTLDFLAAVIQALGSVPFWLCGLMLASGAALLLIVGARWFKFRWYRIAFVRSIARRFHLASLYRLCLFLAVMVPLDVTAAFLVGESIYRGGVSVRYVSLVFALPLLLFPGFVFASMTDRLGRILAASFLLVMFTASIVSARNTNVKAVFSYEPPAMRCIDDAAKRYGWRYGLSDFWNAKPISVYSRTGLRVNQITYNLTIDYYSNNIHWYEGKDSLPSYDFVIVDRLNKEALVDRYGPPSRVIHCGESEIFSYEGPGHDSFRVPFSRQGIEVWRILTGN